MSSPTQTPQLDDAPDAHKLKLENGDVKEGAVTSAEDAGTTAATAATAGEKGEGASGDDAGQAPASQNAGETDAEGTIGKTAGATDKAEGTPEKREGAEEVAGTAPARTSTPGWVPEMSEKAAGKAAVRSPSPPPPPPKDDRYLSTSAVPSRTTSPVSDAEAAEYGTRYRGSEDAGDAVDGSQAEIQSIMEQFDAAHTVHPPRKSSLARLDKPLPSLSDGASDAPDVPLQSPALQSPHLQSPPPRTSSLAETMPSPMSPGAHASQYQQPAPPPDPEPDLPFDFHRFLEQLRHRTADPVAKFLRSFLLEFGKKQWMVHEQVKIIADFLEFISKKMAQCDVWRTVSDAEFDNAREGMEKLVMNRLYSQTFSPAIPPPEPLLSKSRRRPEPAHPGRRGQHQEDVERDEVLSQKVRIYTWVKEEHLDIPSVGDKGKKFLHLAQQELLKMKSYRAPRDKVICILNCCKVIFGYLRTSSSDMSADAFVPLLIYTVLQANPDHLVSNVQYIMRFRNQDKLGGEAGYYISSLMGAIQFIEGLDRTSLTITDEAFEKNVEAAVSAIAERHAAEPTTPVDGPPPRLQTNPPTTPGHRRVPSPHSLHLSEKSAISRPEITNRNSQEAERAGPRRSASLRNGRSEAEPAEEENAAVAGLLRTIQRPLSTIGRIFSDSDTSSGPAGTPQPGNTPRLTPQPPSHDRGSSDYGIAPPEYSEKPRRSADEERHRQRMSAEDAAARQASAEAEEARRIQRQEHVVVVETLAGMFPQLDRDVIDDVVRVKEGRVGLAVDACLALANP
ncbi:hypothetical protein P280DRAFT_465090 [Massarina eburnea CBS 473.64]|uniref:Uncharacterized protein n=1 Tax=Massarina eburnea CBS 473.64 TaxID=1395130 RepID=A0A6A6SC68_9PLEO|nr:hypothetical protein P280DRAFT_465090 [Massarina eburnea CBS 473.64]